MSIITIILLGVVGFVLYKAYSTKIDSEISEIYDAAAKEDNILKVDADQIVEEAKKVI